jgi:hypothetical protein
LIDDQDFVTGFGRVCHAGAMDEDRIIAERISGESVRAIAKSQGVSVAWW